MNITKEAISLEQQKENKRNHRVYMQIIIGSLAAGILFGLWHSVSSMLIGGIVGGISGFFIAHQLIPLEPKRWELTVPYGIFSYFDEKGENVLSAINLGKTVQYGRVEFFAGSRFYQVETNIQTYTVEVENGFVVSCYVKEKDK